MPKFDEAFYREIASLLRDRVAEQAPDWTAANDSDPGVTLIELFAFLVESMTGRANTTDRSRLGAACLARAALALAHDPARATVGARERPPFFDGRFLSADELSREQEYFDSRLRLEQECFDDRLRRHHRELHGYGTVRGLGVSVPRETDARPRVVVAPGVALTPNGTLIEVRAPAEVNLPREGHQVHVNLLHAEGPLGPPPGLHERAAECSRVEEAFAIRIEVAALDDAVVLARLQRADGGWDVDETFEPARMRPSG